MLCVLCITHHIVEGGGTSHDATYMSHHSRFALRLSPARHSPVGWGYVGHARAYEVHGEPMWREEFLRVLTLVNLTTKISEPLQSPLWDYSAILSRTSAVAGTPKMDRSTSSPTRLKL